MTQQVLSALDRYWPGQESLVSGLPVLEVEFPGVSGPLRLQNVALPPWAASCGFEGALLVPVEACKHGCEWQQVDWWLAGFLLLECWHERCWERRHGPIHSYSLRLKGWDSHVWDRAWVNRIALFLRRWAGRTQQLQEHILFGELPQPEIFLTHDVDAVTKTFAIRLKQTTFHAFNGVRNLAQGRLAASLRQFAKAGRFMLSRGDYWNFDYISQLEERHGLRSHYYVYGGAAGWQRSSLQMLLDPAYDVLDPNLAQQLRTLRQRGWAVGLHQSFGAWADTDLMRKEKLKVEQALDAPVEICRQHWLRFSWERTWLAQEQAGFTLDTTLGFNDRPGFRNGAAMRVRPWDPDSNRPLRLESLPMVVMDSHLYDYMDLQDSERFNEMRRWIEEIRVVHGTATVIWHQHVLDHDYGWKNGLESLAASLSGQR